jgi:WD40 repeat protein/class 3 adenylate cyclase
MTSRQPNDALATTERTIRTFLIADIRGYTAFTRELGDEAAAVLAARFAEIVREGVEAWDGELAELRGDEALAVFGSARRALRCALELQDAFQHEVELDPSLPLHVGMGLDAGEAVPVEEGYRGGALNLAARLCSRAKAGEVLASDGVVHLARATDGVRFEVVKSLELKGLGSEDVVRVVPADEHPPPTGTTPAQGPTDLPAELSASGTIAGRVKELRWLRWSWRRARHGHGRVVFIDGAEGSGKTRLAAAIAAEIHADGAPVTYVSSQDRATVAVDRLGAGTLAGGLLVVDDADADTGLVVGAIRRSVSDGTDRTLVLVTCRDTGPPLVRDLIARFDATGERRRTLGPLREGDVLDIATAYASDVGHLPLDRIERETAFQPGPVHRWLRGWVDSRTRQRLEISATQAAEQGERMDRAATQLTEDVLELQLARATAPMDTPGDVCPYKGLAPFDDDDVDYFFGREQLVSKLVAALITAPLLGVTGPSGSGKSSLVRAGLVPAIAVGSLPGSDRWRLVLMRPGEHPIRELERALGTSLPDGGLAAVDGERLLLVVDQFEEIFTSCSDDEERAAFVELLTDAATRGDGRTSIVVAIRADFYGRCATYPTLASLLGDNHVLVGPMEPMELRRAIELPAKHVGLTVEPELIDALVDEVTDEPGGLPLLSTTLLELWQRRTGRVLTTASFQQSGGVRGAVARLAETAYHRLTDRQRQVARAILLRSAGTGEGAAAVRRRVPLMELDVQRDEDVAHVLAALTDARLLTATETTVEVAHEALLREWPRLRAWLEENAEGRRLHLHLAQTVDEWQDGGRDPADLFRGARLAAALDWTAEHALELNQAERDFLEESRAASERDADRQRRTNRRLRGLLVGTAVFLIIALVAGSLAVVQGGRAERNARISTARELATAARANLDVDPERSLLLAIEAVDTTRPIDGTVVPDAELALHEALVGQRVVRSISDMNNFDYSPDGRRLIGHPYTENGASPDATILDPRTGEVVATLPGREGPLDRVALWDVDWSPRGDHIATQAIDGVVTIWDPTERRVVSRMDPGADGAGWIEFSPDGAQIASSDGDGVARVWDVSSGRLVASMKANDGFALGSITWSPDGSKVGLVPLDGASSVQVWDVATERLLWAGDQGGGFDVAWSRDGSTIVTSGQTLDALDAETGRHLFTVFPGAEIVDLEFSLDGNLLAGGAFDGTARVWEIDGEGAREILVLPSDAANICCVTFSPDGRHLAVGNGGYSAGGTGIVGRIWGVSMTGGGERLTLAGAAGDVAWSPTGDVIAYGIDRVAAEMGGVALRDSATGRPIRTFRLEALATGLVFTADGKTIAASGGFGAGIMNVDTGRTVSFEGHTDWVSRVDVSTDGMRAATSSWDHTARIWNARTGRLESTIELDTSGRDIALSPDGSLIATAEADAGVSAFRLWNASTGKEVRTLLRPSAFANAVAFSPDGRFVAGGLGDGTLHVWRVSGEEVFSVPAHGGEILTVAFDRSGSRIVTGSRDQLVKVWDPRTGDHILTLTGHSADVIGAAFSPDGRYVISSSWDGTVRVWILDIDELLEVASTRVTRALTAEECQRYLHHPCRSSV